MINIDLNRWLKELISNYKWDKGEINDSKNPFYELIQDMEKLESEIMVIKLKMDFLLEHYHKKMDITKDVNYPGSNKVYKKEKIEGWFEVKEWLRNRYYKHKNGNY